MARLYDDDDEYKLGLKQHHNMLVILKYNIVIGGFL